MNKGLKILLSLLLLALLCSVGIWGAAASDVYLEAKRPDFQKIPLAILGFAEKEPKSVGAAFRDTVAADLRRSLLFTVVEGETLAFAQGAPAKMGLTPAIYQEAANQGISVLLSGTASVRQDEVAVEAQVLDGTRQESLSGKRYAGPVGALRTMAHRFADEMVYRFTGEQGIARTKIAYVSEVKGARELFVMDYDGHGRRQVTADGFLNLMPRWSPDRRFLFFTSYRTRTTQDLVALELSSGKREVLVSAESLNITPAVSPDGTALAYATSLDGNAEIYRLDLVTKSRERLTFHAGGDLSPTWSPSGHELAFTSDRSGRPQVYVMGSDGSNARRITFQGEYNGAPTWSPRGDWIAHVCRVPEGYKICVTSPDGRERRQITTGPGIDDSPSWSPDGRHLVFSSSIDGRSAIYMINADGDKRSRERLTSGEQYSSTPAWSPA